MTDFRKGNVRECSDSDEETTPESKRLEFNLLEKTKEKGSSRDNEALLKEHNAMDNQFKAMGNQFKAMGNQFKEMDNRFKGMDQQLKTLQDEYKTLNGRADTLVEQMKTLQEQFNFDKHSERHIEPSHRSTDGHATGATGRGHVENSQIMGSVRHVDNSKHYYFMLDKDRSVDEEPCVNQQETQLQPRGPEESTMLVPSGAAKDYKEISSEDLFLKAELKIQTSEKGLKVILQNPRFDRVELHVYTDVEPPTEPHACYIRNINTWEVTIENIRRSVRIAITSPGHSEEVSSFLTQTAEEIGKEHPETRVINPAVSTLRDPSSYGPNVVETIDLGELTDKVLMINTKRDIALILLIACTDHKSLPKVSAHLDTLRLEKPKPRLKQ